MQRTKYVLERKLNNGLVLLSSTEYGAQFWAASKMTKKNHNKPCAVCGKPVGKQALRLISNLSNRMMRICLSHVDKFPSEQSAQEATDHDN